MLKQGPFAFPQFHKAIMADSGVLLLCWLDPKGAVSELRARLRTAFPGAPPKQASILHTTLLRILTPAPLDRSVRNAIATECAAFSQSFRTARVNVTSLWYIPDSEAATVATGQASRIHLAD